MEGLGNIDRFTVYKKDEDVDGKGKTAVSSLSAGLALLRAIISDGLEKNGVTADMSIGSNAKVKNAEKKVQESIK